ncbi:MAG: recombinase family protein, partial [Steroidobacteraceae bacterium]
YQSMAAAARRREFEVIIAEDISRLWRNRKEYGDRSTEFEDLGQRLVTCVGDDTSRDGWMIVTIKLAMAEQARREASYRTRRGLEGNARKGKSCGGRAYGYLSASASQTGLREVNPQEAEIVRRIFAWRAEGWSARRIARQLNAERIPPPGAAWKRSDKGTRRKNPAQAWTPSAIAGDPQRGIGVLNNRAYIGEVIWGRSKWVRSAADSAVRKVENAGEGDWIITRNDALRIIDEDTWAKVYAIQNSTNPRREAVRVGVRKRVFRHRSQYWLGGTLVCASCGCNYIGDGTKDFICPGYSDGHCDNPMRFRRANADTAVFDLVKEHLLSDAAIGRATKYVEDALRQRARLEEESARAGNQDAAIARLDREAADLRRMKLRTAALAAGLAEIEAERAAITAAATQVRDLREGRAQRLLQRVPQIVADYRNMVGAGIKSLADPDRVAEASEWLRRNLEDGRITLAQNGTGTGLVGPVHFRDFGNHLLELAGLARQLRPYHSKKLSGSGGRI